MRETAKPSANTEAPNSEPGRIDEGNASRDQATAKVKHVQFDVLRSALYHDERARWLGFVDRGFKLATILLGSASVAVIAASDVIFGQLIGLTVAVTGATTLVIDFAGRAREHNDLKRRCYVLLADLQRGSRDPNDVASDLFMIYADEPPEFLAVTAEAENRAGHLLFGTEFQPTHVSWWRRMTKHLLAHKSKSIR